MGIKDGKTVTDALLNNRIDKGIAFQYLQRMFIQFRINGVDINNVCFLNIDAEICFYSFLQFSAPAHLLPVLCMRLLFYGPYYDRNSFNFFIPSTARASP